MKTKQEISHLIELAALAIINGDDVKYDEVINVDVVTKLLKKDGWAAEKIQDVQEATGLDLEAIADALEIKRERIRTGCSESYNPKDMTPQERREAIAFLATLPLEGEEHEMADYITGHRPSSNGEVWVAYAPAESSNNIVYNDKLLVNYLKKKYPNN